MSAALPDLGLSLGIRDEWLRPAEEPPEIRGDGRDDVRLLVQDRSSGQFRHRHFRNIADELRPDDLLVLNRSGTLPASLPASALDGSRLRLHVAARLGQGLYRVEARTEDGLHPWVAAPAPGSIFSLEVADKGTLMVQVLKKAHPASRQVIVGTARGQSLLPWMRRIGEPIRYAYVPNPWPLEQYQTVFATSVGSAEMPSAGRPFTRDMLRGLRRHGVQLAYLTLHCGLSSEEVEDSLDDHYLPDEPYTLPRATVRAIEETRARGGRVIAVSTTVVRTLQSACRDGVLLAGGGLAGAVLRPGIRPCAVDGLLTGMHTPRSSHLALLESFLPDRFLRPAYLDAIAQGYRWHEFGDMHLLL